MQTGYFSAAWNDVKSSQGWLGKMFLLGLIAFIPVFGPVVLLGYAFGWARDIAWGVHMPMPANLRKRGRLAVSPRADRACHLRRLLRDYPGRA